MITVGIDFGTHQTKVCFEKVESGTAFYEVFCFDDNNGARGLTLPSFVRHCEDDTLRYGYEAMSGCESGMQITYFKQKMFSLGPASKDRSEAEKWSALYLAYVIFKLDAYFGNQTYVVHMGMPTDANPQHYNFCKRQAIKVMAAAMLIARKVYKGDFDSFLKTSHSVLSELARKCMDWVPESFHEARKFFPIFVFPEAYVSLIPLIMDQRLPRVGPNLFVDIGGGTVDISFFTNQMDGGVGKNRPYLYYYHSIPYGLNMITGQNLHECHNVRVEQYQITSSSIRRFHSHLTGAVDHMMRELKRQYDGMDRSSVMPFMNLCAQILDGRPVCYSGGGSMFNGLKPPLEGVGYNFTQVTTVSDLIDHSKLYVDRKIFHVLATAFSLSHQSLVNVRNSSSEPDEIKLVSLDRLFTGIRLPSQSFTSITPKWTAPKSRNW